MITNISRPAVPDSVFVAPTAVVIGSVRLGEQCSIWYNSVVRGDINEIRIGARTNVQDGCLLHVTHRHPLNLHDCITVGHGAILHGCTIESDCLIAMGAIVLDGAVVESHCIIGAGTLVPPGMRIPSRSLVLGSPGRVVRQLNQEDLDRIESGWKNYVEYAASYKSQLG